MKAQLWLSRLRMKPMPVLLEPACRPYRWNKPTGGMWTSTLSDSCNWFVHCVQQGYVSAPRPHFFVLEPSVSASICEINDPVDLAMLAEAWPDREAVDFPPHAPGGHCGVDWEGVATSFDGIHLTAAGAEQLACGGVYMEGKQNLCGWDSESTLWFRWVFDGVRRLTTGELFDSLP